MDVAIAAIPFVVVGVAICSMVVGILRFLRGDESLVPVLLTLAAPILIVLVGLLLQMLLVKAFRRRYPVEDNEAGDDSSFL
jgi:uncharacterized membrane protein YidH (DUF202 family)